MFERTEFRMGKDIFYIQQIPPLESLDVLGEVQKVLLPALGNAMLGATAAGENASAKETGVNVLYMLIDSIPNHLDGATLRKLEKLLIDQNYIAVRVGGKGEPEALDEDKINEIFTGRTLDLLALMVQVFKVNFGDFSRLSGIPNGIRHVLETIAAVCRGERMKDFQDIASSID